MSLTPTRLQCEHLTDPLAVATKRPRLSWILSAPVKDNKDKAQSAYRIVVSSKKGGEGDLWDSGKVMANQTSEVHYEGKPLVPRQQAFWKVQSWDEKDKEGEWSHEATWTAALEDWPAEWIGLDEPANKERLPDFVGTHWVNHPDDPMDNSPVGTFFLRRVITIDDPAPTRVDFILTVDDAFTARINGTEVGRSPDGIDLWKRPVNMDVTTAIKVGENTIEIEMRSSGVGPTAAIGKMVFWRGSKSGELVTDALWQIRRSTEKEWVPVRVIGQHGVPPWQGLRLPMHYLPSPRVLRKEFAVGKKVNRAMLYCSAFGLMEPEINGEQVTDEWFAPGWTDYRKRVHYRAYDVTSLVKQGDNAIGATLSDGWFAGFVGFGKRNHYGERTRFSAVLWLDYADGTSAKVLTDDTWRVATGGRQEADFLMGERYDANKAISGLSLPGKTEADWHPVAVGAENAPVVEPYPMLPCRTYTTLKAKSYQRLGPERFTFDMGVNVAGVVTLHLKGMKGGEEIVLRHGEWPNDDGTVYTANLRSALATDSYIAKPGDQDWTPRATFHGFRYVQVDGPITVSLDTVTVNAVSNAHEPTSGFKCSDARLNTLWENIDRTYRANFIEVPTDCPQRDERLGWTGDIQVFCRTAMLLADSHSFLDKWLVDLMDGQAADGNLPQIAPVVYDLNDGGPGWADAGTIVPFEMYRVYGDKALLERQFESMRRFVDFNLARSGGTGLPPEKFHCYGDWVNVNTDTPLTVLFTAFLAYSLSLVYRAAEVLEKRTETAHYKAEFDKVCKAFNDRFVDAGGWVEGRTQCGQVVAIAFGIVQGATKDMVFERLARDVEEKGHLTTGFIGTKDLMLVLRDGGRADLAYKILLRDEYPGWLFSIKNGATSIWERWNGWMPGQGFETAQMNSFAHYAFGAVGQFMMETIGGVRLLEPGYSRVQIHVEPGPLEWADAWYDSPRGRIAVSWKRSDENPSMTVTVPPNVTAVVRLRTGDQVVGSGTHTFSM